MPERRLIALLKVDVLARAGGWEHFCQIPKAKSRPEIQALNGTAFRSGGTAWTGRSQGRERFEPQMHHAGSRTMHDALHCEPRLSEIEQHEQEPANRRRVFAIFENQLRRARVPHQPSRQLYDPGYPVRQERPAGNGSCGCQKLRWRTTPGMCQDIPLATPPVQPGDNFIRGRTALLTCPPLRKPLRNIRNIELQSGHLAISETRYRRRVVPFSHSSIQLASPPAELPRLGACRL